MPASAGVYQRDSRRTFGKNLLSSSTVRRVAMGSSVNPTESTGARISAKQLSAR